MQCVPYPDLTRSDGVFNLASHSPYNTISPDLGKFLPLTVSPPLTLFTGPKMYNACETAPDDQHQGSTKLHGDLTDAVNIMLWAAKNADGTPGCALWHIFPATALAFLRKFLIEVCGFTGPGDPIHSQLIYLTPDLLQHFFEQYRILPYTVRQYPGEAVFIPAYCAHQVANLADGIKIASDFFSITNVQRTQCLVDEFRQQRLSSSGDDVLQFYLTLWYAWVNLSRLAKTFSQEDTSHVSFHEIHFLAGSSVYPSSSASTTTTTVPAHDPSPIAIDPPSFPVTSNSGGSDNHDAAPDANDGHTNTNRWERRRAQAKNRKKARRQAYRFEEHPNAAGHWECPAETCKRSFDRGGLFDHL